MKLVQSLASIPMLLSAINATPDLSGIEHACGDGSTDFEVSFNYDGDDEITLGNVMVGSCLNEVSSTSSGAAHSITAPNPWDCGLTDTRNGSISSYSYEMEFSFDAIVMSQGIELIKHSYTKSVSCVYEDNYSASFNFDTGAINMTSSDDGETEGQTELTFEIKSFTDANYDTENSNTTVLEAGNTAYLQAEVLGNFDASLMEWSIISCTIDETVSGIQYPLFDVNENSCENEHIFLGVTEVSAQIKRVQYMIFLFDMPSNTQNYEINCDIEVCMKSADGSECDIVSQCFGFDDDESGST